MDFLLISLVLLLFIMLWIKERRKKQSLVQHLGLPGPKPGLLLGNFAEIGVKGFNVCLKEWTEKYGRTFVMYEGTNPVIVTADVELLRMVFIKEFNKFSDRKPFPIDTEHDEYQDMFYARGQKWRRLRGISSPSFTGKRMKEMSPIINHVVDRIMIKLEEHADDGKPFDIQTILGQMTLDVIGGCAFGIDVNSIDNPSDDFLLGCQEVFKVSERPTLAFKLLILCGIIFPGLVATYRRMTNYLPFYGRTVILEKAKEIITFRKQQPSKRIDFIHLMLRTGESGCSSSDSSSQEDEGNDSGIESAPPTPVPATPDTPGEQPLFPWDSKQRSLTLKEMQGQCFLFLIAGYETTSTTLSLLMYELALHPEVQTKLQEEIDEHFPDDIEEPDYYSVKRLPYMDMVLSETLRLHPIAGIATSRYCTESVTLEGLHLPAGASIQANMAAIHMDKELWGPEDPELFIPERFLPARKATRHQMAYMPFGAGPRQCIGIRFALMEAKIALAKMLRQFTFRKCAQTKVPLPIQPHTIAGPSEGVHLVIERRSLKM